MRYRESLTTVITLDRSTDRPLQDQIAAQIGAAIAEGVLPDGTRLPSTRTLAELLGVSRGVTTAAYNLLFAQGRVTGQPGSGTYVTTRAPRPWGDGPGTMVIAPSRARDPGGSESAAPYDLIPGSPPPEVFPLAKWRSAWREATHHAPPATDLPSLGLPELRHALADHLLRTRCLALPGHELVVTAGAGHGLRLLLDACGGTGHEVGLEEPVSPVLRNACEDSPTLIGVDEEGARLDAIPPHCRAVVVTSEGNTPFGHILSRPRRHALRDWATRTGGQVIEVSCNAVHRPAAARMERLLTLLDGGQVARVGDFCELLTPTLKLGYAVVPRHLADHVRARIRDRGEQPPYATQLAVTHLLRDGTLRRLMRRQEQVFAHKHRLVVAALAPLGSALCGLEAVNTVVLKLPGELRAGAVSAALRERGVRVGTLEPYFRPDRPAPSGLVVGYGHVPDAALRRGLAKLAAAWAELMVAAGVPVAGHGGDELPQRQARLPACR